MISFRILIGVFPEIRCEQRVQALVGLCPLLLFPIQVWLALCLLACVAAA